MFTMLRTWIHRYFSDPQVIILAILLLLGFLTISSLGGMLIPVFFGVIIAYLLEGIVQRLQSFKIPRKASVIIVFCLFMTCLILTMVGLFPLLSRQILQFVQELPSMLGKGHKSIQVLLERYPEFITKAQLNDLINTIASEVYNQVQQILSLSLASVMSLISLIVYLVLVPLLVFFFLKDKTLILIWLKSFLPDNRTLSQKVWNEVNLAITNYIRGKIWEIIIVWVTSYTTFYILGMKFTLLLSMLVGFSVLIPYIGAALVLLPVALVAFFQWGFVSKSLYAVGAYGIIQALDGNLLAPLLLSGVVNLHPVAIIVAVLIFGGLWGGWGTISCHSPCNPCSCSYKSLALRCFSQRASPYHRHSLTGTTNDESSLGKFSITQGDKVSLTL